MRVRRVAEVVGGVDPAPRAGELAHAIPGKGAYSAYARGLDGLWGMYQWLDRAPLGRNETGFWWRRHDEYDSA